MTGKYYKETPINRNNESKRLPVVFLLDISPSMNNHGRIEQLNLALKGFVEDLQSDMRTKKAAEIAIITFSTEVEVKQDFLLAQNFILQDIYALENGISCLGAGLLESLELINHRREKYIKGGLSYFLPYLIVITDGYPEYEDEKILNKAVQKVNEASKSTKAENVVLTFPIGVGANSGKEYLKLLADGFLEEPIIYDDATEFSELFKVISRSIKKSIHLSHNVEAQKKDIGSSWLDQLKKKQNR